MDAQQIINIETKLAYQEDLLQELNRIVHAQQIKMDELETSYKLLATNYARLVAQGDSEHPIDERPPHY